MHAMGQCPLPLMGYSRRTLSGQEVFDRIEKISSRYFLNISRLPYIAHENYSGAKSADVLHNDGCRGSPVQWRAA